ncbi:phytanoyl-CoA dioxygenase family protein [Rhizobium rhizogenes]|uniref:Epoxidase subunit A n=1 Tax=Rhizobium rhizogenes (strain K84 / ATCC BAA-868) TaxID=311403 RepID=B9JP03_RHIR8|nr:epoxidase subunit A [Rhizobium rhizogenes K84]
MTLLNTSVPAGAIGDKARFFAESGYVAFPGLLGNVTPIAEALSRIENAAPRLDGPWIYYEDVADQSGSRSINRIENFIEHDPVLAACAKESAIVDTLRAILGEDVCLFKDKVNLKLPNGGGFDLHQDQQAGWSRYASYFVTAMVAIDPADEKNGCLQVVPGLHNRGLIGTEWEPMKHDDLGGAPLVSIVMEPGDVVFFDSYAPHCSEPNRSMRPRRALYITYNLKRDGDYRERYYADKWASFPPDIAREPGAEYRYRV